MKRLIASAVLIFYLAAPAWAGYGEGLTAYKRGDYGTALQEWKPLAARGHTKAQFHLGLMYEKGRGVRRDDAEAVKWYRKAAERGHANAQLAMGSRYEYGRGVTQDYTEAIRWYRAAAKRNYPWAQRNLGLMYYQGKGVPTDYVRAHLWLDLAASRFRPGKYQDGARQRLADAESLMTPAQIAGAKRLAIEVKLYLKSNRRWPSDAFIQGKMEELNLSASSAGSRSKGGMAAYQQGDYATALQEWKPLADEGNAAAQFNLGIMYQNGQGVDSDPRVAMQWYRRAAEQGYAAAIEWVRNGAEQGYADLQFIIGAMYELGRGIEQNDAKAITWYRRAARQGHKDAEYALGRPFVTRNGDHVKLIRQGRKLSVADVNDLERKLIKNPGDLAARAKLLGFFSHASKRVFGTAATIEARRRHIAWLIRNHPEAPIAGSSEATIDPSGHSLADKGGYEEAKSLWLDQAGLEGDTKTVLLNAADFLQLHDKELAAELLTKAGIHAKLGYLYALGFLRVNMLTHTGIPTSVGSTKADYAFAKKARKALEGSSDRVLLATAGNIILNYGVMLLRSGLDTGFLDFTESLLKRAGASLDRYYEIRGMIAKSPDEKRRFAKSRLTELEKWRKAGPTGKGWEAGKLKSLAKAAYEANDMKKAKLYADELLAASSKPSNKNMEGTAVHHGNLILGRIALKQGKMENAKAFLIQAGRSSGGGTLSSFGPNMALAKELLEAGEKDAVIEYLQLCKSFWEMGQQRGTLDRWIETIRAGQIPKFGQNLGY